MAQSTDGGRGKIGFRHGRHAWEVIWEGPLGKFHYACNAFDRYTLQNIIARHCLMYNLML